MSLTPMTRPEPIVSRIHQQLRSAILSGQFEPGERLIETRLAELLQVSRTPIRAALSRLEFDGLAVPSPEGGLEVADFTDEIMEVYGLRERIEGFAARLAAQRITDQELEALDRLVEQSATASAGGPFSLRARLNQNFHYGVASAARSSRIEQMVENLYVYSLNPKTAESCDAHDTARHQAQHEEILRALHDRKPAAAERATRRHLQDVLESVAAALDKARVR